MTAPHKVLDRLDELSAREMFVILLGKFEQQATQIEEMGKILTGFLEAEDNRIYNLDEIAELLKVHVTTVRRWVKQERLEYVSGTKYKCTGAQLKSFLHKNKKNGFLGL